MNTITSFKHNAVNQLRPNSLAKIAKTLLAKGLKEEAFRLMIMSKDIRSTVSMLHALDGVVTKDTINKVRIDKVLYNALLSVLVSLCDDTEYRFLRSRESIDKDELLNDLMSNVNDIMDIPNIFNAFIDVQYSTLEVSTSAEGILYSYFYEVLLNALTYMDYAGKLDITLKNDGNNVVFRCSNCYSDRTTKTIGRGEGLSNNLAFIKLLDSEALQTIDREFNVFSVTLEFKY